MGWEGYQNLRGAKWDARVPKITEDKVGWERYQNLRGAKWDARVPQITEELSGMEGVPKPQRS